MVQLWLMRHGQTDWNVESRFQGLTDRPLNDTGRGQAQAIRPLLHDVTFDAVYSSELHRAYETACIATDVADGSDRVVQDARLNEIGFGRFEGHTFEQLRDVFPDDFAVWQADRTSNIHGGDRIQDVYDRMAAFLDDMRQRHDGQRVLVVSHGGTLALLMCVALGCDISRQYQFRFFNATISEVRFSERGTHLIRFNAQVT